MPPSKILRDRAFNNAHDHEILRDVAAKAVGFSDADDLHPLVEIGNILRDRQMYSESDAIYSHILTIDARYPFVHYELAISLMNRGRHVDALISIENLLADRPNDHRGALLAARLSQGIGAYDLADRRLCIAAKDYCEDAAVIMEFGQFMRAYPRGVGAHLSARFEADPRFLDTYGVLREVRAALAARRGFALIRLGDGEGAFMSMPREEEQRFSRLYARNRADRANVWFAGELDLVGSGFQDQAFKLADLFSEVDIIGVPYRTWLESEYDILSIISISTLVNALRIVRERAGLGQLFCRQDVHAHMNDSGELRRLLGEQSEVGLISCHPGLPDRLKALFGYSDVEFHKLPGEKLMRNHLGEEAVAGRHFPDVFEHVMAALNRPLAGKLFLVGGGIFGKFYCARIKASGGVALDIGSVADAWAGAPTRAGITPESAI